MGFHACNSDLPVLTCPEPVGYSGGRYDYSAVKAEALELAGVDELVGSRAADTQAGGGLLDDLGRGAVGRHDFLSHGLHRRSSDGAPRRSPGARNEPRCAEASWSVAKPAWNSGS